MSEPDARSSDSIRIGDVDVAPGYRTQVDLPIADLSIHVPMAMPVHVINGAEDGPVLFVSAAIHGDELNGVEIIRRIIKLAALRRLKGALIAVPIVNVPGFLNLSRYLPDRRDLNRSFPGSSKGSLAARLAQMFVAQVLSNATHGIDLHTGAVHRENYPQIRVDLDNAAAEPMARAFGAPLVVNSASRDGSLREAADKRDVPVIVYEAGEALRFDETAIRTGLRGVIGVMEHLGMVPTQKRGSETKAPVILRESSWVRAPASGVVRVRQPIGAEVEGGELLAVVSDPLGESESEIKSPMNGVIVGRTNLPLAHEGDALFHIGFTEEVEQGTSPKTFHHLFE
jgi:hypothetical protein